MQRLDEFDKKNVAASDVFKDVQTFSTLDSSQDGCLKLNSCANIMSDDLLKQSDWVFWLWHHFKVIWLVETCKVQYPLCLEKNSPLATAAEY